MAYAILRVEKLHTDGIMKFEAHNRPERQKKVAERPELLPYNIRYRENNEHLKTIIKKYAEEHKKNTGKALRKDAVVGVEFVLTFSPDKTIEIAEDINVWCKRNLHWIQKETKMKVVAIELHLHEHTPHLHVVALPLDKGKFCAKKMLNNKYKEWQDSYAEYMQVFGLERGINKEETNRIHTTKQEWLKEQARLYTEQDINEILK